LQGQNDENAGKRINVAPVNFTSDEKVVILGQPLILSQWPIDLICIQ